MGPSGMLFGAHKLLGSIKHEECFEQQMTTSFSRKHFFMENKI
jgi:hypothetical protein